MKWINHKLLTGAVVFAITGNPIITMLSSIGSVIPDAIEGFPDELNYQKWRRKHRRYSHWFLPYLITFFLCYAFAAFHGFKTLRFQDVMFLMLSKDIPYSIISAFIVTFLALGALFHIAEDAICGKIPGIDPKERIGVKIFFVGSIREYIIVFILSFTFILIRCRMENII